MTGRIRLATNKVDCQCQIYKFLGGSNFIFKSSFGPEGVCKYYISTFGEGGSDQKFLYYLRG